MQNYRKRHEKALSKAQKSDAEGESLKLVKEFYSILPLKVISLGIMLMALGRMIKPIGKTLAERI